MNGGNKNMYNNIWATKLTANDSSAKEQLGAMRIEWNSTDSCFKKYKYVQAASDTTVASGTCLGFSDTLGHVASSDSSVPDAPLDCAAGVGIGAITASYYGWIQVGGYHSAINTNGGHDIVAGVKLFNSSTDGCCDSMAANTASTNFIIGVAVGTEVNATDKVAAYLTISPIQ